MKRGNWLIAGLAGLTVLQVVLIALVATGPAPGQGTDRTNGFVMSVGQIDRDRQAMYLVDERSAQMVAFITARGAQLQPVITDARDLRADFAIPVPPVLPPERGVKPPER